MQSVSLLILALIAIVVVDAKAHKKQLKKVREFVDNDFDSINDYDEGYEADTYGVAYFFRYRGQEAPSQWLLSDNQEDLEFADYYDDDAEDDRWVNYDDEEEHHHHKKSHKKGHKHY